MPHPPTTPTFVGRTDELATIEVALVEARLGRPSVMLVGGDAGIGKSTLVEEAARRVGVEHHLGRCVPLGGDDIPLAPVADLLRQIRRTAPDEVTASEAFTTLRDRLRTSGSSPVGPTGPGAVFAGVLDLVERLAETDAVVVGIEDLHWADAATWDLFEFLARSLVDERVLLVGTHRGDEIDADPVRRRRLAELARLPSVRSLHLDGLGRDDVVATMTAIIGHPPAPTVVEEVLARGQGNPFFTGELVTAHLAGEPIPTVLADLIAADLADLDDPTAQLLGVVAILGGRAGHDVLRQILELDDRAVEAAVRVAMTRRVLVVDGDTDEYRFRHALIGEVVYRDLLPSERRRLHREAADAVRKQAAAGPPSAELAGALAFHLDRAGDPVEAFPALLAAADVEATVAPATALHHLERAFAVWDEVGEAADDAGRGDRLWQAAELATGTVGNPRAVELARQAFAFGPPARGAAWGHERLGRYLWASGRLEESAVEFDLAAALLADDRGAATAPVRAGLAQAALMARDLDGAERWGQEVFDLVPGAEGDPGAWATACRVLGAVRSARGDPPEGVRLSRDAVAAADTAFAEALATMYLCLALLDDARYEDAVAVAAEGRAYIQRVGLDHSFGGYLDALAAEGLTRLGQWATADDLLARHVGVDPLPAGALRLACARAVLAARRGQGEEAARCLADAATPPVDPFHQAYLDRATVEVHLALGDWKPAAEAAAHGAAGTPEGALLWLARFERGHADATVELALDALAAGQPVDPAAVADQLEGRRKRLMGRPPTARESEAELTHLAASLTRLSGPDPDAWAEAARRWEHLHDPWQTAMARLREAEAAVAVGDLARGSTALRAAHSIATELDAPPVLAEVAALGGRARLSVEDPAPTVLEAGSVERLGLTPREAEVLALVAAGRTNREIGGELYISEKTASVHVSNILRKLGVTGRVDAAAVAQRLGIAEASPGGPET